MTPAPARPYPKPVYDWSKWEPSKLLRRLTGEEVAWRVMGGRSVAEMLTQGEDQADARAHIRYDLHRGW